MKSSIRKTSHGGMIIFMRDSPEVNSGQAPEAGSRSRFPESSSPNRVPRNKFPESSSGQAGAGYPEDRDKFPKQVRDR